MMTRAHLQANLDPFEVRKIGLAPNQRAAAVALVVSPSADRLGVWLTRRPATMRRHAAQFALPGGRLDPGETPHQAATRELNEELGVELNPSTILGDLDDYPTRSGFVITPTVMWTDDEHALRPDSNEVETVFHIDLADLAAVTPHFETIDESDRPVISLPLLGTLIHAPTAAILYQFARVALNGEMIRVADLEQPPFAWS